METEWMYVTLGIVAVILGVGSVLALVFRRITTRQEKRERQLQEQRQP